MGLAAVHFGEVYGYFQRRGIWQNPVGMLPCEDLYSSYVLVLCFNLRNDYYICHGIWKYFICSGSLCILLFWIENQEAAPVALVCEKKLLVSVPWSFLNSDFDFSFKSLYMPIEYSEITGVSNCWDHLYIGARVAGGIVGLPVQMSCVSRKDKKKFKFWISKKQEENRHVSRLTF